MSGKVMWKVTLGESKWSIWDWVKVILAGSGAISVYVLITLLPEILRAFG